MCGVVTEQLSYRCLMSGVEVIQRVLVDLVDEFKDEFPNILRISQSNQMRYDQPRRTPAAVPFRKLPAKINCYQALCPSSKKSNSHGKRKESVQKISQVKASLAVLKINRGTLIQGLNRISSSSKSVAKLLQPQLACRLLELRGISHHLLREVNAPEQPLCHTQARKGSLFEIISFPAKTVLTSIMYASYAALIYLAVGVKAVLEKVKTIFQEEESIRRHRESGDFRKSFSERVFSEPMFPEGEIKPKPFRSLPAKPDSIPQHPKLPANEQSNEIQVLHSVFDQSPSE